MESDREKLRHTEEKIEKRALLVGTYKGNKEDKESCIEHLKELTLLTETYGATILDLITCPLRKYDASTFIGKGKVEEITETAKNLKANFVIFDDEISPAQQRNLEKKIGLTVMDRTELIIEVFAQRAQSKEACLQIELAKTQYQLPRLKRLWTHLSRQRGGGGGSSGGGYQKGEGEKQLEIDKRLLKQRISKLQKEIKEVKHHRGVQRIARERSETPVIALIGYTNVGKSTLLNALTEAEVFVEDKLFATLDTTTRKFTLSNNQEILLIDTVGFIRKLPHQLVAAFRSTLEESVNADVLLHLIDASHKEALNQAEAAFDVLKKLSAEDRPIITVINKIDQCDDPVMINKLRVSYPKNIQISAKNREGFDELEQMIIRELENRRSVVQLRIPQKEYVVVSKVTEKGKILHQEYEENDVLLKVDLPIPMIGKYQQYLEAES